MGFVNCSPNEEEQNLLACQYNDIFFKALEDASAGMELLV